MCSTYFYFHLKLVICEITDSLVICLHDCIQVLRYDSSERIYIESHMRMQLSVEAIGTCLRKQGRGLVRVLSVPAALL